MYSEKDYKFYRPHKIQIAYYRNKHKDDAISMLSYLRFAPKIIKCLYAPYINFLKYVYGLKQQLILNKSNLTYKDMRSIDLTDNNEYFQIFIQFARLFQMDDFMRLLYLNRIQIKMHEQITQFTLRKKTYYHYQGIQSLNLIRPNYYLTQALLCLQNESKARRFDQSKNNDSFLYKDPRFIDKLHEFYNSSKTEKHKNNILLLQYNGNFIVGNRTYAVCKGNSFQIWDMKKQTYPNPFVEDVKKRPKSQRQYDSSQEDISNFSSDSLTAEEDEYQKYKNKSKYLARSFKFLGHTSKITCASFSKDQFYILTGSADRTIRLWCLRLNICLAVYKGHIKTVWDIDFNPSGLYFLSGGADGLVNVWKTDSYKPVRIFMNSGDIYKVSFAKHPSTVIGAGEEGQVKFWYIMTGELIRVIRLKNAILNFNLGHSGQYILILELDGRVTILDLLKGQAVGSFYYYFGQVWKLDKKSKKIPIVDGCFSEDEETIACVANKYILTYRIEKIRQKNREYLETKYKETKLYEDQIIAKPELVIQANSDIRFNYCQYGSKNALIIGGNICKF